MVIAAALLLGISAAPAGAAAPPAGARQVTALASASASVEIVRAERVGGPADAQGVQRQIRLIAGAVLTEFL
jgi:hypothetical protein